MDVKHRASGLAGRALLAIALTFGFYALALTIGCGLLLIPYFEVVELHRVHLKLSLACVVGGVTILWSVIPRRDRFEPPGPRLSSAAHPRLFDLVQRTARATQQTMPDEVYLVHDMNAFVTQRGGFMGVGSRRVMGIGLPLMQALNVSQFEGVLAHEFGHYHGGDVKLGPWIYQTRNAIGRTIRALAASGSRLLHRPFQWYGELFLRVTHAISRQQERAADALAARIVGARPLSEGLKITHGGALGFELYWREDVLPTLEAGFRPPLLAGFTRFLAAPRARELMDRTVEAALKDAESDPYDTHPPLPERLAALRGLSDWAVGVTEDTRPAIELLDGTERLEVDLLSSLAVDPSKVAALVDIDWNEVGQKIYPIVWADAMQRLRPHLNGLKPGSLPQDNQFYEALARKILGDQADGAPGDVLARFGASQLGLAVAHHMTQTGWVVQALPGESVALQRGTSRWEPIRRLIAMIKGEVPIDVWRSECADAGIASVDLGAADKNKPVTADTG